MKTYIVNAEWGQSGWWVITVPEVRGAISQARRLDQVAENVHEVLELMTGEKPDQYEIDLRWSVPGEAGATAEQARRIREEVDALTENLEAVSVEAVRRLRMDGFSYRDIGMMLGISHQRAHQLVS